MTNQWEKKGVEPSMVAHTPMITSVQGWLGLHMESWPAELHSNTLSQKKINVVKRKRKTEKERKKGLLTLGEQGGT